MRPYGPSRSTGNLRTRLFTEARVDHRPGTLVELVTLVPALPDGWRVCSCGSFQIGLPEGEPNPEWKRS